ncbi:MAG: sigma-70 family RNA polymerase sigma factor [Phycisphaerales bacterium]
MTQITSDTDLWRACRDGERDAFRRVVERYQGLVTSITYNATGDIPTSEDLAQDTFLQAWRKIGTLREPDKLAGWLCAIARNRVRDWLRRKQTDVSRKAVTLTDAELSAHTLTAPDDHAQLADESALVWRAIESIPEQYREALVLHYREQLGNAQMAEVLNLNEAAVRQRLTRARAMVREELAAIVEKSLRRSRPSQAFTLAVMAALPAMTPKVATAAVGGTAAAKASGSLLPFATIIGPAIGLIGGLAGSWMSIKQTDSKPERRFMIRFTLLIWLVITLFIGVYAVSASLLRTRLSPQAFIMAQSVMWLGYAGLLIPLVIWGKRRQRAIRREQGSPDWHARLYRAWSTPRGIYGGLGGAIFGGMSWIILFALQAKDPITAWLVGASSAVMFLVGATALRKVGPKAIGPVLYGTMTGIAVVTAVVVNTRLHAWIAILNDRPIEQVRESLPLWSVNVFLVSIYVVIFVTIGLSLMTGRGKINPPDQASAS